jgi:hypothetical protein
VSSRAGNYIFKRITDLNETHKSCVEYTREQNYYSVWMVCYTENYFPFGVLIIPIYIHISLIEPVV